MEQNKTEKLSISTNQIVEINPNTITYNQPVLDLMVSSETKKDLQRLLITKRCKKCLQDKPLDEFRKQARAKDKHKPICKVCDDLYQKQRYNSMKPYYINRVKDWQKKPENKDRVRGYKNKFKNKSKEIN
jgi:hypothetical protein